jgi:hypothetical protein
MVPSKVTIDDLLLIARYLPLCEGRTVALSPEQQSYLIAAAKRYGVDRTWIALNRAVETGPYDADDIVKVTWTILKGQRKKAVGGEAVRTMA